MPIGKATQFSYRNYLTSDVFAGGYDRVRRLYDEGHNVVVATSGGKDSTVIMELAIMAARDTGRLPVPVVTRDEEIMYPGTFEHLERVAEREDVEFHHLIQDMACVNVFNRQNPYFWPFDKDVPEDEWVRKPPEYAYWIPERRIEGATSEARFPRPEGTTPDGQPLETFVLTGIRVSESFMRRHAITWSSKTLGSRDAYRTVKRNPYGVRLARPIYDWTDGDVWKFMKDMKVDYNKAYDVMVKVGMPLPRMRIAPPTQKVGAIHQLQRVAGAWPRWFDRMCKRLPGVRTAVQYGIRALRPERRLGETWEDVYKRAVLGPENPEWIRERGEIVMTRLLQAHSRHATGPFPQMTPCPMCDPRIPDWKTMVKVMYLGDPFGDKQSFVGEMQPEYFKPGAGTWD